MKIDVEVVRIRIKRVKVVLVEREALLVWARVFTYRALVRWLERG